MTTFTQAKAEYIAELEARIAQAYSSEKRGNLDYLWQQLAWAKVGDSSGDSGDSGPASVLKDLEWVRFTKNGGAEEIGYVVVDLTADPPTSKTYRPDNSEVTGTVSILDFLKRSAETSSKPETLRQAVGSISSSAFSTLVGQPGTGKQLVIEAVTLILTIPGEVTLSAGLGQGSKAIARFKDARIIEPPIPTPIPLGENQPLLITKPIGFTSFSFSGSIGYWIEDI